MFIVLCYCPYSFNVVVPAALPFMGMVIKCPRDEPELNVE